MLLAALAALAVGILGSIAWLVWYDASHRHTLASGGDNYEQLLGFSSRDVHADLRRAQRTIQVDDLLNLYLLRFQRRAGRYPARLEELIERPPDLDPSQWDGPYVTSSELLEDPWARPYQYRFPGVHNNNGYDLWSLGPDGVDGTNDDVITPPGSHPPDLPE